MDLSQIYAELIVEHNQSGRNKRTLVSADIAERGHNPSCGDDIMLQLKLSGDVIEEAAFVGSGCAISQASTSMMIDLIQGKTISESLESVELFLAMIKKEITNEEVLEELGDAMVMQNISNMPARVKCAVLAWHTLREAIKKIHP